jgi:hypothetical protein
VTKSPAAGAVRVAVAALTEGVIRMMWLARLKPLIAIAAALILATTGVAVHGRQKPATDGAREQAKTAPLPTDGAGADARAVPDPAANRDLAMKQLALIEKAWAMVDELARSGRLGINDLSRWGHRRLETLRRTGAGKAEIVAALEKYVKTLNEYEAIAKDLVQSARATQVAVYDVQYLRMEAEIWLNEEKAR